MNATGFQATKEPIGDMLDSVGSGATQLPDFQRGWVWDDHHIRDLIASVSLSFPIGAVMTLQTGGDGVRFKPRPIEGTDKLLQQAEPNTLVLDGQQRLTSLFQSLKAKRAVDTRDTKGNATSRWYYLDMKQCLEDELDRAEAILSVPEDRKLKTFRGEVTKDLSTPDNEYSEDMFPLRQVFDTGEWMKGYMNYWKLDQTKWDLWTKFEEKIVQRFKLYDVPVISLGKDTPKEAVCIVFEKVNQGGVSLTVFELLTASFAADDFQLRDDWAKRQVALGEAHRLLTGLDNTLFLQTIALLSTKAKGVPSSCRRRDILRLTTEEYKTWADRAQAGFVRAALSAQPEDIQHSRYSIQDPACSPSCDSR